MNQLPVKCPVMVVDDDPATRSMVVMVLGRAGYTVVAEEGGEACLDRVRAGFRGLILMDIVMPGMDGWETIRCMVSEGLDEGNLICMLTGIREPGGAGEGLEESVMDYLTKPIEIAALLDVARRASECVSE